MRSFIFVLVVAFLPYTWAFGLYGGYERVFYYYAYRAAYAHRGNGLLKAGNGCWHQNSGKSRPCNFRQFVHWITPQKAPTEAISAETLLITNEEEPDIHKAASDCKRHDQVGAYEFPRIFRGFEAKNDFPPDIARLIKAVGEELKNLKEDEAADVATFRRHRQTALQAIDAVQKLRENYYRDKVEERLRSSLSITSNQIVKDRIGEFGEGNQRQEIFSFNAGRTSAALDSNNKGRFKAELDLYTENYKSIVQKPHYNFEDWTDETLKKDTALKASIKDFAVHFAIADSAKKYRDFISYKC